MTEFNDHQRDVFCVFSGIGVQRLRAFLNSQNGVNAYPDGALYDGPEDPDVIVNVTAQANIMSMEEMDEDAGDASEMLVPDEQSHF